MDPRADAFAALVEAALGSSGSLPAARRRALAGGDLGGTGPALGAYLEKVDVASYETTDDDVAAAVDEVGQEAVFEATVAVAVGAARRRLDAALEALGGTP